MHNDTQSNRTFLTCSEHEHCQQEIRVTTWDDKPNQYVVIHHRDADPQPDSPRSPEGVTTQDIAVWFRGIEERLVTLGDEQARLLAAQSWRERRRAQKKLEG